MIKNFAWAGPAPGVILMEMKKFSELPYERISFETIREDMKAVTERLANAESYEAARQAFLDYEKITAHVSTVMSIAMNRYQIDTRDPFYSGEREYWSSVSPRIGELRTDATKALYASKFRPEFEREFGSLMFKNMEIQMRSFSPELIPGLQEESRLTNEYGKLIASAQIDFMGGKRTLPQMTPFKASPDDEVRRAAWNAEGEWYNERGEELDRIYDELVKVRTDMAKKLGHKNFVPLGYDLMNRNSYTEQDVERFREAVVKYVVPVACEVKKAQAERIGAKFPMLMSDEALFFRSGNARPAGSSDDILAHGKRMYHEMSPETAEFVDFLYGYELMDVLSKPGKAGGGHCATLMEYGAPFIFSNFNGTQGDVEVVTHEAGHAFASYMARDIEPMSARHATLESCEIHSMSMEFFAWNWAEGFFGADTDKFRYSHLASALAFIPYGTMVDHFQHIVYEHPELTPAERHAEWKKLEKIYRPWLDVSEIPFYGDGRRWQAQSHIYQRPFYYIDYCLAQTVALQFWALMHEDREDAWRRYMALVRKAGTETFDGLVATAGLDTPFGEKALETVASAAKRFLDRFDAGSLK